MRPLSDIVPVELVPSKVVQLWWRSGFSSVWSYSLLLLWLLRKDRVSLGLRIAYLYSLWLFHLPRALAHMVGRDFPLNLSESGSPNGRSPGASLSPKMASRELAGCGKTRFEARAVSQNSIVSTTQPDKKKLCEETTSSGQMCPAT